MYLIRSFLYSQFDSFQALKLYSYPRCKIFPKYYRFGAQSIYKIWRGGICNLRSRTLQIKFFIFTRHSVCSQFFHFTFSFQVRSYIRIQYTCTRSYLLVCQVVAKYEQTRYPYVYIITLYVPTCGIRTMRCKKDKSSACYKIIFKSINSVTR